MTNLTPPRVFISYSHDSDEHRQRVLDLAQELRRNGIDAIIDRFVLHPKEGWPRWMQHQIEDSNFVLIVCTATYKQRFDGRENLKKGHGANWEGFLAAQLIYDDQALNERIIPVIFEGAAAESIPLVLRGSTYYRLPSTFDTLLRRLTSQPEVFPEPLGQMPYLPLVFPPLETAPVQSGGIETASGADEILDAQTISAETQRITVNDARRIADVKLREGKVETRETFDHQAQPIIAPQLGPAGNIMAIAVSCDGKWIVGGCQDQTVKIWDIDNGQELHSLVGHLGSVDAVAISWDSRYIVSGGRDKQLKIWDASTGRELRTLQGHTKGVNKVIFSPDGSHIISSSSDEPIRVWDLGSGRVTQLKPHGVLTFALSPNGKLLAALDCESLEIWDMDSGQKMKTLIKGGSFRDLFRGFFLDCIGSANALVFSPDNDRILLGGKHKGVGVIKVWDIASGQELSSISTGRDSLEALAISADGCWIATASNYDDNIRVWDALSGDSVHTLRGSEYFAWHNFMSLIFCSNGYLISQSNKRVTVWEVASGRKRFSIQGIISNVRGAVVSRDSQWLVSCGESGYVWHMPTGRLFKRLKIQNSNSVAISPDGHWIATGGSLYDGTLTVWDTLSGQQIRSIKLQEVVRAVAVSNDGSHIVSATRNFIKVWDANTGSEVHSFTGGIITSAALALSSNNQWILWGNGRTIRVLDMANGNEVLSIESPAPINALAITSDNRFIVTGDDKNAVRLWDASIGLEHRCLRGHAAPVMAVATTPDCRLIVSASCDGILKIWDITSAREIQSLKGHHSIVNTLVISADDGKIISASADGSVRIWDLASGHLLATLIALTNDNYITYTPDGYYVASDDAELYIAFRISKRIINDESVRSMFRRPDVIESRLIKD